MLFAITICVHRRAPKSVHRGDVVRLFLVGAKVRGQLSHSCRPYSYVVGMRLVDQIIKMHHFMQVGLATIVDEIFRIIGDTLDSSGKRQDILQASLSR